MPEPTLTTYLQAISLPDLRAELDAIFFAASATQVFAGPASRAAFRERWLGRYLVVDAAHAFVAIDADRRVAGYLVGCLDDPARLARFADQVPVRTFAALSASFPAHLHINLVPQARNRGLGQRLIETFAAHAISYGAPGVHVVTGARSRNVRFYQRCGFEQVGRHSNEASDMVFLGRRLN